MAKFNINNGHYQISQEDIDRAFKATGAAYHYVFGGFMHVYTSQPLTKKQQQEYEEEAKEELRYFSQQISDNIDAKILKEILTKYKI